MMHTSQLQSQTRPRLDWLALLIAALLAWNVIPFLAPVFMQAGWEGAGRAIYLIYGAFCHQMAQRSFFLFGPDGIQMYNLARLPLDLSGLNEAQLTLTLRRFTGDARTGWKVAWSDRMVYMYVTPLVVAVWYGIARRGRRIAPLPLWAFFALLLPMALDGGTHLISDYLGGLAGGFRYDNGWLAALTGSALPASFYAGDAFGSFNSWMRLLSGVTFGIAAGGFLYPYIDDSFKPAALPGVPVQGAGGMETAEPVS